MRTFTYNDLTFPIDTLNRYNERVVVKSLQYDSIEVYASIISIIKVEPNTPENIRSVRQALIVARRSFDLKINGNSIVPNLDKGLAYPGLVRLSPVSLADGTDHAMLEFEIKVIVNNRSNGNG